MALWNKVKTELDRAGKAAQQALDEGRTRLDLHRARQNADRSAQRLGYAIYRARKQGGGGDIAPEEYTRLAANLTAAELEVERVEAQLAAAPHRTGPNEPA